jgi:hypothetical protein
LTSRCTIKTNVFRSQSDDGQQFATA